MWFHILLLCSYVDGPFLAQRREAAPIISTGFHGGREQGGLMSRDGRFDA